MCSLKPDVEHWSDQMRDTQPNFIAISARSVKLASELLSIADVRNPSSRHAAQYT